MLSKLIRSQDFLAGLLFVVFGCFTLYVSSSYPMGTATSMGPGMFPRLVSYGIIFLGAVTIIKDIMKNGDQIASIHLRPLVLVTFGIFIFGWKIDSIGLVICTVLLVIISRIGGLDSRKYVEIAVLAVISAVVVTLIFVYGFDIPFPVFPR